MPNESSALMQAAYSQAPGEGPFSQMLQIDARPQAPVDSLNNGWQKPIGSVAMIAGKFLEGMQRGKARSFMQAEAERGNQVKSLGAQLMAVEGNPDVTADGKAQARTNYASAVSALMMPPKGAKADKQPQGVAGHFTSLFKQVLTGMTGGKMPERGKLDLNSEIGKMASIGHDEKYSVPAVSAELNKQLEASLAKSKAEAEAKGEVFNQSHVIGNPQVRTVLNAYQQKGIPVPETFGLMLQGLPNQQQALQQGYMSAYQNYGRTPTPVPPSTAQPTPAAPQANPAAPPVVVARTGMDTTKATPPTVQPGVAPLPPTPPALLGDAPVPQGVLHGAKLSGAVITKKVIVNQQGAAEDVTDYGNGLVVNEENYPINLEAMRQRGYRLMSPTTWSAETREQDRKEAADRQKREFLARAVERQQDLRAHMAERQYDRYTRRFDQIRARWDTEDDRSREKANSQKVALASKSLSGLQQLGIQATAIATPDDVKRITDQIDDQLAKQLDQHKDTYGGEIEALAPQANTNKKEASDQSVKTTGKGASGSDPRYKTHAAVDDAY